MTWQPSDRCCRCTCLPPGRHALNEAFEAVLLAEYHEGVKSEAARRGLTGPFMSAKDLAELLSMRTDEIERLLQRKKLTTITLGRRCCRFTFGGVALSLLKATEIRPWPRLDPTRSGASGRLRGPTGQEVPPAGASADPTADLDTEALRDLAQATYRLPRKR